VAFLTETEPARGVAIAVAPGVRRIIAANAGPFTYHGTNTWLVTEDDGVTVIDPGPDDAAHVGAILSEAAGPITRIVLTHTHPDHVGAVPALKARSGATVFGWGQPWAEGFAPDVGLGDGDLAGTLRAIHTPGHASDHLCFAMPGGVLFSGDHVMSWSTSIVNPPDGDMAAYMDSLRLLLGRDDSLYLGGHGPPLREPQSLVRAMLTHRIAREAAVLAAVEEGAGTPADIVARLYTGAGDMLRRAAERSVLAHLLKLEAEDRVAREGELWRPI
jgi:glyoxylase-like metal-dependent hydrolase (beta-lactamase superfamily II)